MYFYHHHYSHPVDVFYEHGMFCYNVYFFKSVCCVCFFIVLVSIDFYSHASCNPLCVCEIKITPTIAITNILMLLLTVLFESCQ